MRHQSETHVEVACDVPGCAAADREPLPDLSREWFAHDRGVVAYGLALDATDAADAELRRRLSARNG